MIKLRPRGETNSGKLSWDTLLPDQPSISQGCCSEPLSGAVLGHSAVHSSHQGAERAAVSVMLTALARFTQTPAPHLLANVQVAIVRSGLSSEDAGGPHHQPHIAVQKYDDTKDFEISFFCHFTDKKFLLVHIFMPVELLQVLKVPLKRKHFFL